MSYRLRTRQLHLRITADEDDRWREAASILGWDLSGMIREAVQEWLERREGEIERKEKDNHG